MKLSISIPVYNFAEFLPETLASILSQERASEVEVRFIAEGPGTTRVELEHRGFERMGEGAAAMSEAVASPGGWGSLLELFAETVSST